MLAVRLPVTWQRKLIKVVTGPEADNIQGVRKEEGSLHPEGCVYSLLLSDVMMSQPSPQGLD